MTQTLPSSTASSSPYLVLARKYRPQTFQDGFIGQEALVRTLTNAIELGRLHHAYVLSGIRGVGKTTTARILAKVLNCEGGPSVSWAENDPQCAAIGTGSHVDVLEFDAASHTGVDDIRTLFEGVNYAPVQGRYKVYIVDEVHMLSKSAFNALLKTLEEPPPHVKFIFATTEVNKIPVTVLSRCQRFDLKRIPAALLAEHFTNILTKENLTVEEGAVRLIARAADGSARDGLSLLDQAIALSSGGMVTEQVVADMLGLADRGLVYDLFEALAAGDPAASLGRFEAMHGQGYDAQMVLSDLLHLVHFLTRLKVVPGLKESRDLSELERSRGIPLADQLGVDALSRLYQMLLAGAEEAKKADRPHEVAEMVMVRVTYAAGLPSIEELLKGGVAGGAVNVALAAGGGAPPGKFEPSASLGTGVRVSAAAGTDRQTSGVVMSVTGAAGVPDGRRPADLRGVRAPFGGGSVASVGVAGVASAVKQVPDTSPEFTLWRRYVRDVKREQAALGSTVEQRARLVRLEGRHIEVMVEAQGLHSPEEVVRDFAKALNRLMPPSESADMLGSGAADDGVDAVVDGGTGEGSHGSVGGVWTVSLARQGGGQTISECKALEAAERVEKAKRTADVLRLLEAFPGAEVVKVDVVGD